MPVAQLDSSPTSDAESLENQDPLALPANRRRTASAFSASVSGRDIMAETATENPESAGIAAHFAAPIGEGAGFSREIEGVFWACIAHH
jgi:hypothetical protein